MWWQCFATELILNYRRMLRAVRGCPQVTGVDIGYLYQSGSRTANVGLRVHLREEKTQPLVPRPIPWSPMIAPAMVNEHGAAAFTPSSRTAFADPICPGIQVCNVHRRGGTLGLLVLDRHERPHVLSSLHVLGSPLRSGGSPAVVQPAPPMMLGVMTNGFDDVMGDVAIATIDDRDCVPAQFGTGALVADAGFPHLGDPVTKSGVASDITSGIVDGIGRYMMGRGGREGMDGFRVVAADATGLVARPGDSGALWYNPLTDVGYGLHVAGEASDEGTWRVGIACHLAPALDRLGVTPLRHPVRADR